MRRGMVTFEYVYIIGLAAAALITMMIYISRGFQGNVRAAANQIGAEQFDPRNTSINNVEIKHMEVLGTSGSSSTVVYGTEDGSTPNATTDSSENTDQTTVTITKHTNEGLGTFANDTWN